VFASVILPPYLRKSGAVEELVPWLCFKGISRGEFPEALQALLGEGADGFSPIVVIRVKERWRQEYEEWSRRDLSKEEFVYVWADRIHVNVRREDKGNLKQCLLGFTGVMAEGRQVLIAVIDGVREGRQSW
jgi:putative transposase